VPLNFVATVDSIGGNSGSPVVNRNGEVVGLLFNGNIQSLSNNLAYREDIPRSLMVHGQGIVEALLKVYEADALVDELQRQKIVRRIPASRKQGRSPAYRPLKVSPWGTSPN
jgi:S1-C subfamily serine protease